MVVCVKRECELTEGSSTSDTTVRNPFLPGEGRTSELVRKIYAGRKDPRRWPQEMLADSSRQGVIVKVERRRAPSCPSQFESRGTGRTGVCFAGQPGSHAWGKQGCGLSHVCSLRLGLCSIGRRAWLAGVNQHQPASADIDPSLALAG